MCHPPDGLPDDVFCTGLYLNRDASQIADDVMPYTPGVTLWSDGAEKLRYFAIPDGTTIRVGTDGDFEFPNGTVTVNPGKLLGNPTIDYEINGGTLNLNNAAQSILSTSRRKRAIGLKA